MGRPRIDLTGQKFGPFIVLDFVGTNEKHRGLWKCKCICGNIITIVDNSLKKRKNNICICNSEGHKKHLAYLANTKRIHQKDATAKSRYSQYKYKASKFKQTFTISFSQFKMITQQNCYYCGIEPSTTHIAVGYVGKYVYNGIDRIDSSKGYEKGNIVACCTICNRMKRDYSQEKFLAHVEQIYKHQLNRQTTKNS